MLTDQPKPWQFDTSLGGGTGDAYRNLFRADPLAVRDALRRAVARFARQITVEDAGTLELTLAEALNNVVEHGYACRDPGLIDLRIARCDDELQCRIVDAGVPMPGLAPPNCTIQPPLPGIATLPEGGWGWALIREMTTDLDYRREHGRNILTFHVPVTNPPRRARR